MVEYYLIQSLALSTQRPTNLERLSILIFVLRVTMTPYQLWRTHCKFAASITDQGLKHTTIKSYLSGIRHMQIMSGFRDPFVQSLPKLEYVLREIKLDQAKRDRKM